MDKSAIEPISFKDSKESIRAGVFNSNETAGVFSESDSILPAAQVARSTSYTFKQVSLLTLSNPHSNKLGFVGQKATTLHARECFGRKDARITGVKVPISGKETFPGVLSVFVRSVVDARAFMASKCDVFVRIVFPVV
jgi:hypothetical protein